jgi:hypothetical protein
MPLPEPLGKPSNIFSGFSSVNSVVKPLLWNLERQDIAGF